MMFQVINYFDNKSIPYTISGENINYYAAILGIIFIGAQIINVFMQMKANEKSKINFENLALNLENRVSSAFNLIYSGHFDHYPNYQESIDNFNLYRTLSSGHQTKSNLSLFNFRMQHYTDEKEFICRKCLEHIATNFKNKSIIYLMIDSGSTVFPIFKLLCDYYWLFDGEDREPLKKIRIITNNLPGVNSLLLFGRKDSSVNAEMMYRCKILPGRIDGKYSAILDIECANHLNWTIRNERQAHQNDDIAFISIITGNYISIKDGVLWRGDDHGAMKDAYIYNSDYVYILSPLGKIFDKSCKDIIYIQEANNSHQKKYHSLKDIENIGMLRFFDENNAEITITMNQDDHLTRFLPDKLLKRCGNNIFLFTTKRVEKKDSLFPGKLGKYFAIIIKKLEDEFGENLKISSFDPEISSNNVKHQLHYCVSQREDIFYNYEFPHAEVRNYMKNEIESRF